MLRKIKKTDTEKHNRETRASKQKHMHTHATYVQQWSQYSTATPHQAAAQNFESGVLHASVLLMSKVCVDGCVRGC